MNDEKDDSRFRLPVWLDDGTNRWRMRIGYHFGKHGRRVEKLFYWPGPDDGGGVPPPHVQAAAVELQRKWRALKRDWIELARSLKLCFPNKAWSMPVWCDEEQEKMSAGEAAGLASAMDTFFVEEECRERDERQSAVSWVSRNGLDGLIAALRESSAAPAYFHYLNDAQRERALRPIEDRRITTLAELAPTVQRRMLVTVTVRDAVKLFLKEFEERLHMVTDLGIDRVTAETASRRLYAAFGVSSNPDLPPVRKTPIDLGALLVSLDEAKLLEFANYWHGGPEGVRSERTIKNYLEGARQFFVWCDEQSNFGWRFPAKCRRRMTAGDQCRGPLPFDPDAIRKLITVGGNRVRVYALFALGCGYYQQDIVEVMADEYFSEHGIHYVKRLRSKERRVKQGRRPLCVRHYIAPEFAALIESERGINSGGTLFNTKSGTVLTAANIHDRWKDVQERAGVALMFSQLRKMGYNAIKRLGGREGPSMAEFWDGHAKGSSDAYDDGIWPEMNEVERLWSDELRQHKILAPN